MRMQKSQPWLLFLWLNFWSTSVQCRDWVVLFITGRKWAVLLAGSFVCASEYLKLVYLFCFSINALGLSSLGWLNLKMWILICLFVIFFLSFPDHYSIFLLILTSKWVKCWHGNIQELHTKIEYVSVVAVQSPGVNSKNKN